MGASIFRNENVPSSRYRKSDITIELCGEPDSETKLRRRGVVAKRIENEVLVIGGLHHLNTDTPMETESWTINENESVGNEKLVGDALLNFAFSRSFLVEEGFCQ